MGGHWTPGVLLILTLCHSTLSVIPGQCPASTDVCYFKDVGKVEPTARSSIQYFAVGGLFDIRKRGDDAFSCGDEFNPTGILHSQAFLWAMDYWQKDSPSVSIGAVVFDSCERKAQLVQNILGFEQCNIQIANISRKNVVGFVGPTSNMDAMTAAKLTADMDLTVISPSADSTLLSSFQKYPFFLRTSPTANVDIDIMTYVLEHVGTKYVAAIYEESQMASFALFREKMESRTICISGSYAMTGEESTATVRNFVENTLSTLEPVRFIALFLSPSFLETFMSQVTAVDEVKSMNLIFLVTSEIRRSSPVFGGQNAVAASDAIVLERAEPESVRTAVNEFKTYWNPNTIMASLAQKPRVSDPFLTQYLSDGHTLPEYDVEAAYTIMAAAAFVRGTQQAGVNSGCQGNNYLCSQFFDNQSRGTLIYRNIRSTTQFFTRGVNDTYFENGDLRSGEIRYNIYRYLMNGTFVKIGEYSGTTPTLSVPIRGTRPYRAGSCQDTICLQCGELAPTTTTTTIVPTTTLRYCQADPEANYSLVYYPLDQEVTGAYMESHRDDAFYATRFEIGQRWIIALGVLAGLGIVAVLTFEIYILYKLLGTSLGQKWRTMWLGQLLLFGVFLCYLTLFAYIPIPTKMTCGITRFGVGFSYSVCFAVLLVKLMVILTSKSTDSTLVPGDGDSANYLKGIYQFLMFIFVVGVQVVIDAQWLIFVPPEAVNVKTNSGGRAWVCNHYTFRASEAEDAMTDMGMFVRSEFENHVLSLVYIMFLILITTILALKAHGIVTNHREGVFIGVAAGFSIPVWLAWTLVAGLNKDRDNAHEFGDACIAFGLFVTATLLLFAMFIPKARQLYNMGVEGVYFDDDHDTVYGGSVIMAPSYKSRPGPGSVIYMNSQGIYSDPIVLGSDKPTPASTYSAPPTYLKRGDNSTIKGGSVLRVTDDLSGRRPLDRKRATSEMAYATSGRPRSQHGTMRRYGSQNNLGAL